jgi:hypothetical protein
VKKGNFLWLKDVGKGVKKENFWLKDIGIDVKKECCRN